MNWNFIDPELPTNRTIIDPYTWYKNFRIAKKSSVTVAPLGYDTESDTGTPLTDEKTLTYRKLLPLFTYKRYNKIIIIINICGYSVVGNLKYDIYYLKKELRQEEIRLDELKAKVDTNSSIREIEEKAKEELNMDYLKKNQIRYIEVEN